MEATLLLIPCLVSVLSGSIFLFRLILQLFAGRDQALLRLQHKEPGLPGERL